VANQTFDSPSEITLESHLVPTGINSSRNPRTEFPLVAISGSRGKTTVATMLSAIIEAGGDTVGSWLSSGVYAFGDRLLGELGPWQKVLLAALHGELDVAIQEMHAPTVTAVGLPPQSYSMAICGNNEACLLAAETRTERSALDTVVRAVRSDGCVVAGVDDFDVAEVVESTGKDVLMFALRRAHPVLERHLNAGGAGAWAEDDDIFVGRLDDPSFVMDLHDIPATLGGTLVFQVQNALAAALAAWSMGYSASAIEDGLRSYSTDPSIQPAACNIIAYNGARIVIDSPRQIWSLRMLMRGVRHLPRRRTMVVSGVFRALPLEDVAEAGRLLGTLGAIVVLHAGDDETERLDALRAGIATSPTRPLVVQVQDELHAIDHMLNKLGDKDVGLVLASDPVLALQHLWPAPAISVPPPAERANGVAR
jgi:cyanophycin synthetase